MKNLKPKHYPKRARRTAKSTFLQDISKRARLLWKRRSQKISMARSSRELGSTWEKSHWNSWKRRQPSQKMIFMVKISSQAEFLKVLAQTWIKITWVRCLTVIFTMPTWIWIMVIITKVKTIMIWTVIIWEVFHITWQITSRTITITIQTIIISIIIM